MEGTSNLQALQGKEVTALTYESIEYDREPERLTGILRVLHVPTLDYDQCWIGDTQVDPDTVKPIPDEQQDGDGESETDFAAAVNTFCPTGEGGGVDPTCGKDSAHDTKVKSAYDKAFGEASKGLSKRERAAAVKEFERVSKQEPKKGAQSSKSIDHLPAPSDKSLDKVPEKDLHAVRTEIAKTGRGGVEGHHSIADVAKRLGWDKARMGKALGRLYRDREITLSPVEIDATAEERHFTYKNPADPSDTFGVVRPKRVE